MAKGIVAFLAVACSIALLAGTEVRRVCRPERYWNENAGVDATQPVDEAAWIWMAGKENETGSATERYLRFRRRFRSPGGTTRIDVSADERFVLLLDGVLIARGPDRGTVENWVYQTYDIDLSEGEHVIEAVVWRIGDLAPLAQMSWHGGFILKADGEFDALLTTGKAGWRVGELHGTRCERSLQRAGSWGCGYGFAVKGCGFIDEEPTEWTDAVTVRAPLPQRNIMRCGGRRPGWILFPSQLESQIERTLRPGTFKIGNAVLGTAFTIPPHTRKDILWDLENYYCAYPSLKVSGGAGAKIAWGWAEALREENGRKTRNRAQWQGKRFVGFTDLFLPDGRKNARFTVPWWRCGRWVKISMETADEPLTVQDVSIAETRYPLEDRGYFACDDETIAPVRGICIRGMQMCAHEMLFDCPFYEQQMYPGDTRIQLRVLAALDNDDRLIRRAMEMFDYGRRNSGLVPMNHPSRGLQESVTYSMCYLMMYADYVRYHENVDWLKARLPGLRHVVDGIAMYENEEGLIASLAGWNYVDRLPEWTNSVAPDGASATPSAINNLYWAMALEAAADVERALGHVEMAQLREMHAARTLAAAERLFWDEKRGMYADTVRHDSYSEHAQCIALACRGIAKDRARRVFENLVSATDLARCTVYFSYYLFDAYFKYGRGDLFMKRLDLWRSYVNQDLKTPLESPDPVGAKRESRSDCHAWGSHPLVFMHRGIAGIDSAAPFFRRVRVAPCPGSLRRVKAKMPHPKGSVDVDLTFGEGTVSGSVMLPPGISGEFAWGTTTVPLVSGTNTIVSLRKDSRGDTP